MMKILVADDHSIVRLGLKLLIQDVLGNVQVDFAEDGDGVFKMIKKGTYDMLISDINMPKDEGVTSVFNILQIQPTLKILIMSVNPEAIFAKRYFKAGVYGYIQKSNSDEGIKNAIRTISLGKRYFSSELMNHLAENFLKDTPDNPFDKLSDREFEVAMLLLRGLSLNEVAKTLSLHTSTTSTHKIRLFEKLGVLNVVELVSLAKTYHIV